MTVSVDLKDVPQVTSDDLAGIMQTLIASEHGLVLIRGITEASRNALETAIWKTFADAPERRVAVLMRFECLVELFASRRLKELFLKHGLVVLEPALALAATQRLNTSWGFNPQKFMMALTGQLKVTHGGTETKAQHRAPRSQPVVAEPQLAA